MTLTPMTTQNLDMAAAALYPMMSTDPAAQRLESLRDEVCNIMFTMTGTTALNALVRFAARDFAGYWGNRESEECILRQVVADTNERGWNYWVNDMMGVLAGLYVDAVSAATHREKDAAIERFMETMYRRWGLDGMTVLNDFANRGAVANGMCGENLMPDQVYNTYEELMMQPDTTKVLHWIEIASMDATRMKGIF